MLSLSTLCFPAVEPGHRGLDTLEFKGWNSSPHRHETPTRLPLPPAVCVPTSLTLFFQHHSLTPPPPECHHHSSSSQGHPHKFACAGHCSGMRRASLPGCLPGLYRAARFYGRSLRHSARPVGSAANLVGRWRGSFSSVTQRLLLPREWSRWGWRSRPGQQPWRSRDPLSRLWSCCHAEPGGSRDPAPHPQPPEGRQAAVCLQTDPHCLCQGTPSLVQGGGRASHRLVCVRKQEGRRRPEPTSQWEAEGWKPN